ncbi:MAG: TIGR03960 family B12-binding radical SAM protein [Armatimonadota bacterium]|nr:TIGR03960 family B12-binding radical SAM protein [Armatimonadota bacterium]
MLELLDNVLSKVAKPARYIGGEFNAVIKDLNSVDVKFALAFPDVYEIGMSNLGLRIIYEILNRRLDTAAERIFAPWPDMEAEMRRCRLPLFTLESHTTAREFDIIGFSLSYELTYTNVLNMLDLIGIPIRSAERNESHPLIIAGGCCVYNPEPMADFVDAFVIGEGEEIVHELVEVFKLNRSLSRKALLEKLAEIPGVYVPALGQHPVRKRLVKDLDTAEYLERPIIPFIETVHDRLPIEVMRGCSRGCRFCQAGMIYRPVRERSQERILKLTERLNAHAGYDEIGLLSLSTADYTGIEDLVHKLIEKYEPEKIGVSLPSIRADASCVELASEIQKVRKSGLTLAPEAGTQRLRDVINKNVTAEDLLSAVEAAFRYGWRTIKLYFMIGLPTETDEDVLGIAQLAEKVSQVAKKMGIRPTVNVSVSSFVPKPHTPFQWRPQDTIEELQRKQSLLRSAIKDKAIQLSWHDARISALEGVLSRGDRKVGEAIYHAWKNGCKFDAWDEYFDYEKWLSAFSAAGITPASYANRPRDYAEPLPWDHIDCGISKQFLINEDKRANRGIVTPDCREEGCAGCGVALISGGCPVSKNTKQEHDELPNAKLQMTDGRQQPTISQQAQPSRHLVMLQLRKGEDVKYLGHLDMLRTFEKALRRARIHLAYTAGFNPRPRMSFGTAIGVGTTSDDERIIIELTCPESVKEIQEKLNSQLPPGLRILSVEQVQKEAKSLLTGLNVSVFRIAAECQEALDSAVAKKLLEKMLSCPELRISRIRANKSKEIDIRPYILSANVIECSQKLIEFEVTLKTNGSGGAGPRDFLEAARLFFPGLEAKRIHRIKQTTEDERR